MKTIPASSSMGFCHFFSIVTFFRCCNPENLRVKILSYLLLWCFAEGKAIIFLATKFHDFKTLCSHETSLRRQTFGGSYVQSPQHWP